MTRVIAAVLTIAFGIGLLPPSKSAAHERDARSAFADAVNMTATDHPAVPGEYVVILKSPATSPTPTPTATPPTFPHVPSTLQRVAPIIDEPSEPIDQTPAGPAPDPAVVAAATRLTSVYGGSFEPQSTWSTAIRGFLWKNAPPDMIDDMSGDWEVEAVEENITARKNTLQSPVPWNLDRIDQRSLPLDGSFTPGGTGSGVTAYVIDTGIRYTHREFGGRAVAGYDAFGGDGSDCDGHGTHVAGVIGGATYGVARGVRLVNVRVMDCSGTGTLARILAGVNWVTWHRSLPAHRSTPAVANMSLGGRGSFALDRAVQNSIASGITYVVSAGNTGIDARDRSPARITAAITVGATDYADRRALFSNFGRTLDLFAPGVDVVSASAWGDTGIQSLSGTSVAAPQVAGAAALYLQSNPRATPAIVSSTLTSAATKGVIADAGEGSPNRLIYARLHR